MDFTLLTSLAVTLQLAASPQAADARGNAVISDATINNTYSCPRCRRATPPGPRKGPTPPKWKPNKR